MIYNRISKEQYYNLRVFELFSGENVYNKCYATIVINNLMYKFAWESDMIIPVIKELPSVAIAISVDRSFSIIRMRDNAVIRWSLTTNIIDVFFVEDWCIGICEMNVVSVKLENNPKYYKEYSVDDFISAYKMDRNMMVVLTLSDGSLKKINLQNDNNLQVRKHINFIHQNK